MSAFVLHPAQGKQAGDPFGYVQFIHAATDVGAVDIRVDGGVILSEMAYRTASEFEPLAHGPHSVTLFRHGEQEALARLELSIEGGNRNVVVALGTRHDIELVLRKNVRAAASTNRVEFFVVHAAFDTGPIDIRLRDPAHGNAVVELLNNNLAYATSGIYLGLDADGYIFDVTSADNLHTIGHLFFQLGGFARQTLVFVASGRGMTTGEGFSLIGYQSSGEPIQPDIVTQTEHRELPVLYSLAPGYPNPSSSDFRVSYTLGESAVVQLDITDVLGRRVVTVQAGEQAPGSYNATWDGRSASGTPAGSGIYFCRLRAGGRQLHRKLVLAR